VPNHGKGGRKPERGEAKRSAIAVRTTPTIKAKLEAAADEQNRSVTQEVEARLEASLAMDHPERTAETIRLLGALAAEIERAEQLTGKRWHNDLKTWAMVREALASGEIERRCPELERIETDIDGDTHELRQHMTDAMEAGVREKVFLQQIGVYVSLAQSGDWPQRTDKEKALEQIKDAPAAIKELAATALDRLLEAEEAYAACWKADSANRAAFVSTIMDAEREWRADLVRRGLPTSREYRPEHGVRNVFLPSGGLFGSGAGAPRQGTLGSLLLRLASEGNNDSGVAGDDTL
jgi:hypothetical protein